MHSVYASMENVPYQFEPLATEADLWTEWSSEDEEEEEASLPTESQRDWCKCGKCPEPARELERVCCLDYGEVVSKFERGRQSCITEHEGVFVNCLSKCSTHLLPTSFGQAAEAPVGQVLLPFLLGFRVPKERGRSSGDPERALAAMEVGVNQGKLRLLKTQRRLGLVRGRLLGAREAKGAVLVFLDSHCECGPGWLPPLLQALQLDKRKIVSPYIDVIRSESFAYARSPDNLQGDFSWRLEFGWRSIPLDVLEQRAGPQQPIDTPVISGGLFAVWMCGGKMEIIPCSRVGHVFRSSVPYTFPGNRRHTVLRNLARAALVWMDDYSRYFFAAVNMSRDADVGDVSSRVALRERLQCRSFEWYLSHVVTQLHVPSPHALHYGQFKNKGSLLCLTAAPSFSSDDLHLVACQGGDNQLLDTGQLELGDRCVIPAPNKRLALTPCHHHPPTWGVKDGHLGLLSTDLCLTSVDNEFVRLQPCRSRDPFQIWEPSYSFSWTGRSV
ncbi:hypothetical protein BaRGS_00008002 [Batillaria attramentaria]|uniref:Polypeptide N-acetylgalactosaminyltransferase n=1 Tax=Batillaria attramentaria TaxID=370345 RepID=A0ABD0LNH1_9CAEN